MIENELQFVITARAMHKLMLARYKLRDHPPDCQPWMFQAQLDALNSVIEELCREMQDYELSKVPA